MNLELYVKEDQNRAKKYQYFLKLGFSEKASMVLAAMTYGRLDVSDFLKTFDRENRLDKLYAWLVERPEETPEQAFSNENVRNRNQEHEANREAGFFKNLMGGVMAKSTAKMSGGPVRGRIAKEPLMEEAMVEPRMTAAAMSAPMAPPVLAPGLAGPEPMGMPAPEMTGELRGGVPAGPGNFPFPPNHGMELHGDGTDSYESIEEKDASSVLTAPTSTFRMTTTTASMGILLNQIRSGRHVDMSQVRIEEVLNYFDYDFGPWTDKDAKFRICTEHYPKTGDRELFYVGVEAESNVNECQNVILLLDVSGSMSSQNVVTQEAIATIIGKLREGDVLSLVTYSSEDETIFENHVIAGVGDKEDLMGRILEIQITGCTNGSAGIETAYTLGKRNYKEKGCNQVILITDGDLNFGVTQKDGLKELIEEKKKTGLFLSVIGTGLYNYKDDKLEVLTKHGNGTYCVVNSLEDVDRCVNQKYVSLTNVVAKDVKAQVEFNPKLVKKYRLLGFENRTLAHEDFVNDKVISEPYGSGGHGVALYELWLGDATTTQELKYQQVTAIPSEELCTVKVRYKEPLAEESIEISKAVIKGKDGDKVDGGKAGKHCKNARLAYFLYCIAEKLRRSDKLDDGDEKFFEKMRESGEYKEYAGESLADLELLLKIV
ncbi:MAG: von Willebrand factor type A domain-containing protein [Lachnospiraceae bacterium]|nr:von Willebrand factor type A domain-containing protein [Lachnospiraceae bacterium]